MIHSFDTTVVKYFGLLFSLNMIYSSKMYIYILFEMLDQKTLEDFSDIYPLLKRPNHLRELLFPGQQSTATTFHSLILIRNKQNEK